MKLPSINNLYKEASVTLKRFPFVIFSSVLGAVIMVYTIGVDFLSEKNYEYLYQGAMACLLGIPLLLSAALYAERNDWSRVKNYILSGGLACLLIIYYISLPGQLTITDITRFALFVIGLHLLVSFIPFIARKETGGFWLYNEIFFIRFLTSGLHSGVLFAGLCIAIASFDNLFNVNIEENIYPRLFFFIAGVFNTWFFLSGIPQNFEAYNAAEVYPKGLKLFTQFVLMPLVTVYLIILFLYTGKILIEWNWPIGWVSYLILGFSVAGIFSILLIYPIRNKEGNTWMNKFSKWFYIALLPLIVVLFFAIMRRISDYGITENRYYVFILALWLAGIALYFTLSKAKNIKVIPVSLCLIAFLSSFGPWGAFSVSTRSQMNRLEAYLTETGILQNGQIIKTTSPPAGKIQTEISSILTYLDEKGSLNEVEPWFNTNLDSLYAQPDELRGKEKALMDQMGLKYNPYPENERYFNYFGKIDKSIDVRGYDLLYSYTTGVSPDTTSLNIDSNIVMIRQNGSRSNPAFLLNGEEQFKIDFLKIMKEREIPFNSAPDKPLTVIDQESGKLKIKMIITQLSGERENGTETLTSCEGKLLVKIK